MPTGSLQSRRSREECREMLEAGTKAGRLGTGVWGRVGRAGGDHLPPLSDSSHRRRAWRSGHTCETLTGPQNCDMEVH